MSYQAVAMNEELPPPVPPKKDGRPGPSQARPPQPSDVRRRYGPSAANDPVPGPSKLPPAKPIAGAELVGDKRPWGTGEAVGYAAFDGNPEADDWLHNPDPKRDGRHQRGSPFTARGCINIGCLSLLAIGIVALFAGYPIVDYYTGVQVKRNGAFNLGGINSTGQVPLISNFPSLIDSDTPEDAYSRVGFDGEDYNLVFSDEFNKDGRTFFPGDDPFWTAVDIHYWPTGDYEWYDPSAITTKDGDLVITMTQEPIHDLNFKSGMLQSWNQLCFQYSYYLEVRVSLPGNTRIAGFWPGIWTMGNLGRAGFGASTEGMWPYTYDSCDVGTLKNQTNAEGTGPEAALTTGPEGGGISFLPGQRLSACTCPGEDHPGPAESYGRGVPEIDVLEGQLDLSVRKGHLSQSFQVAPFDESYAWLNSSKGAEIYDNDITIFNSYTGGIYQQAVSGLTHVDSNGYQGAGGGYGVHAIEVYSNPNDRDSGRITWVANGAKTWTVFPPAVGPSPSMQIGQRIIPEEPMSMILNFGMSDGFQAVDWAHLEWPAKMLVDYVRVYQRTDGKIGCDPSDRPTADYIARHPNVYSDANLTTWDAAGYAFPKNSLIDTCNPV
ncbi:uncharacterized protein IL334_004553 [Kwoniella shivajii]|uniref:GH16 domain-containing protein n=1 Tax=Kwoniella shivajii TaxID=564305 RepID=A0ABZ1D3M9_9TREE|nr:hypothetical protein IL334_004553 [Kwoniella shivajii]